MAAKRIHIGVLYSGGLDSAALVGQLLKEGFNVWPVYVQCELPWEKTEKYWAKKFLKTIASNRLHPMMTVRLLLEGAYKKNWSQTGATPGADSTDDEVFLPARNLLLITKALLALSSHGVSQLAIGTLSGNPFPDGKPEFFKLLERLLRQSFRREIKIRLPFRNKTKTEVLKANQALPLHMSFSCINPQNMAHCGTCNKCAERINAFQMAGIPDKTAYKKQVK